MNEFLGRAIKERREELRMSQEDLERASNISRGTISSLENGKCKDMLVGTLLSIAKALDTSIDNFFATSVQTIEHLWQKGHNNEHQDEDDADRETWF